MNTMKQMIQFALTNFGPLLVFYTINHFYGLKIAIIASVVFGLCEVVYLLTQKVKLTGLFKFSMLLTVIFGAIDLTSNSPIFFKYEAAVTNIITGIYFGMTLWSPKTVIQEFMEKRTEKEVTDPSFVLAYRIFTWAWTTYFFLKASLYVFVSSHYSIEEALVIRSAVGNVSFYVFLGLSLFCGRPMIRYFKKVGWLPSYESKA